MGGCKINDRALNVCVRRYINEARSDWGKSIKYYTSCNSTVPSSYYYNYAQFERAVESKSEMPQSLHGIVVGPFNNANVWNKDVYYRLHK